MNLNIAVNVAVRVGVMSTMAVGLVLTLWPDDGRPATAYAGDTLSAVVDPATHYQTVEGWGTSLAWFANVLGTSKDPNRTQYANLLFNRNKGLGLNIVRYNIGGGENPTYTTMEPRAAVPGYEPTEGSWNWNADANQRWFLQAAIERGANRLEAFSNSPPYWMTASGSVTGSVSGSTDNLNPKYNSEFAMYLTTVVNHFRTHWGITFQTVDPFNEPTSTWWKFGGRQEGAHFEPTTQNTVVKLLGRDLSATHAPTRVTVSDDNSIDDTLSTFSSFDSTARQYISKINTHAYNGYLRADLYHLAKKTGKDLWMSEYGDGDATGLTMAVEILADMKTLHDTAWVYWQAVDDSSGAGWGMLSSNLNHPTDYSYQVNEKYYVMGNYSEFIRPGSQIVADSDPHSLAAFNPATHQLVVVETNVTGQPRTVSFSLANFKPAGNAYAYFTTRFGATDNLKRLSDIPVTNQSLVYTASPYSVTTLVIKGVMQH